MFTFLKRRRPEPARPEAALAGLPAAPARALPASGDAEQLLRRLEWTVLRRLDGQLQGDYRSLFRGAGLVLADLREYQAHDDVRHIDWNVTARMQVPYVREHQEDRELAAWFLIDASGSMCFGSGERAKRTLATEAIAALARLLSGRGNRVGALLYGGTQPRADTVIPARGGRRHVLHLLHRLLTQVMPPAPAPGGPPATDLRALLRQAQAVIRRRSLLFVVSDFIAQPGWEQPLMQLARRHEVVAVRVRDPLEAQLPDAGLLWVQDAETGEQLLLDTGDAGLRRRFADAARQREQQLCATLAQAGVDCLELNTDEALDPALLRFARLRKLAGRLAAGAGSTAAPSPVPPAAPRHA